MKQANWKKVVYLVCMIQVFAGISMIGVVSFIPLFLSEIGITDPGEAAFWAGLISGVTPFMIAFSAPFWSLQADRRGPKFVMSIILTSVSLSALGCAFVTSPVQILALRTIQGLVGGFVPIGLAIVAGVTPEEKTSWAMGYFQAAMVMGIMFGPLVGGMIADFLGYRMPFVAFAALSLLCLVAVWLFLPPLPGKTGKKKESAVKEMLFFLKIPRVRLMTFMQFLCNFGITGIGPILPLYVKDMAGGTTDMVATVVGFIIFIAGGASALASLNVGNMTSRFKIHRILIGATLFVGFTFIMQYMMNSVIGLGFFRGVTGLGMGLIAPCTNTILAKSVPPDKRTIVFGTVSSIFLMGNVAGPVFSGALAMSFGYASVFWSTAAAFIGAALLLVWNFRNEL